MMICRLCLENLNVDSAIRLFDCAQGFGNSDIVAMITKYFTLELTPEDTISTRICQVCFDHLEDFNRFWKHIDKKQQSLQEQYKAEFLEVKCDDLSAEQGIGDTLGRDADALGREGDVDGNVMMPIKFENEDVEECIGGNEGMEEEFVDEKDENDDDDDNITEHVSAAAFCKIESDGNSTDDTFSDEDYDMDSFSSDDEIPLKSFEKSAKTTNNKTASSSNSTKSKASKKTVAKKEDSTKKKRSKKRAPVKYIELDCEFCEEKIINFDQLVEHFKAKHDDKNPTVKCCDKILTEKSQYLAHMKWHRFAAKCPHCDKILSSERSMKSHVLSKHQEEEDPTPLVCEECDKSFASRRYYDNHLQWHKNQGQYICETCGKSYTTEVHLKRHVQSIHNHVYPYKCQACNEFFNFKEELENHDSVCEVKPLLNQPGKKKPNQAVACKECGKIFGKSKYLRRHMKAVHANIAPLVCDQCGKNFKYQQTFEKHVLEHAGVIVDQPVQCEKCGKWCKNKVSHRNHVARHDEILNKCHLCGRECPSRRALKGHMETIHRDEKNFKCQYCEKSFKSGLVLKEHIAKHTNTKLYSCPHCSKDMRSRANMYTHIKKNHYDEWVKSKMARSYDPKLNPALNSS